MPPTAPPAALAALDHRLTAILMALRPLIARHFLRHPWVPNAVAVPLWNRIGRYARRLSRLITLFAEGRLPMPRPPRVPAPGGARPRRAPAPPIPRRHGWMLAAMGWHVALYRSQLESLLAAPEAAEFIAAAPAAGRLLRPLCHMLGVRHASLGVRHAALRIAAPGRRPPRPRPTARPTERPEPAATPAMAAAPAPPVCQHLLARWPWAPRAHPSARPEPAPSRRLSAPRLILPA